MRPGFTLIETLVAMMIAAIAIIALAGTAALVAAQAGEGAQLTEAAQRARSILDSLASRPCAEVLSGADTSSSLPAAWTIAAAPAGAVIVEVTVHAHSRRGTRAHSVRSAFACDGS